MSARYLRPRGGNEICSVGRTHLGGDWEWDTQGVVYYEWMKRELKIRPIYECRFDERLKTKSEESTLLVYTGLINFNIIG